MMGKWTLEQFTSDDGEKFDELRCDGVIAMLLPRGCVQMGWEGGDLKRFLCILNAHDGMMAALNGMIVLVEAISKSGRLRAKAEENLNLQIGDAWRKAKAAIAAGKGGTS